MKTAFYGDPNLKAALLEKIDRHVEDGTLVLGATAWDGDRGSPLGVLAESESVDDFAKACGYPLALAGLLDPLAASLGDPGPAFAFVRDWIACVEPGADLTLVPTQIVLDWLDLAKAASGEHQIAKSLDMLHRRELAGERVPRQEWSALRNYLLTALDHLDTPGEPGVLSLCEAALGSASTSRSILVSTMSAWSRLVESEPDPEWPDKDRARADALLQGLWDEQSEARDADEYVDYPALFRMRDPDLSARFEANLTRSNERVHKWKWDLAESTLDRMRRAPVAEYVTKSLQP